MTPISTVLGLGAGSSLQGGWYERVSCLLPAHSCVLDLGGAAASGLACRGVSSLAMLSE